MSGFGAFLGKELGEIARTWRLWVLPGIVLFLALSGPPLAKVTPELVGTLISEQQTGVLLRLPYPTYVDAYLQWTKNLSQLVLFAVIIISSGAISSERRSGTAVLVLTKPLSRSAFVLAKFVSHASLLITAVTLGALVTWGVTYAVFAEAPLRPLAEATGAWLALALLFVGLMLALSAVMDSQSGAAGLGFVVFITTSLGGLWRWAAEHTPAGLFGAPSDVVTGQAGPLGWPIVSALALTGGLVTAAILIFGRREL